MAQELKITKKKMGRPPGRVKPPTKAVQIPLETIAALDDWIEAQPDPKPSRPEAIRGLIERALSIELS
jgi:hypothetical protein